LVEAKPDGDRVLASAHSSELKDYGWKGPCGNLPAAYLTGLLAGHRAKTSGIAKAILDMGLHARGPGSRIFAATKGAIDAGLTIPHDDKVLPPKDRVQGTHLISYSKQIASNPEAYKRFFSAYLKNKLKPEDLSGHFTEVEAKIKASVPEVRK
jgi:large subunit ribosomal protein L18